MKRLGFFLQLLVVGLLACQSLTPTPSQTPMPTASATYVPSQTPAFTATTAVTSTVTATPIVAASTATITIKKDQFQTVGADYGTTLVCDQTAKKAGIINPRFRMKINSPDGVTTLKVATYKDVSDSEMISIANDFCPEATVKFSARPNFTYGEWLGVLPSNWEYAKVPNLLRSRNDYWQSPVVDPRKVLVSWSVMQVTCSKYPAAPEKKLPKGIKWQQDQVYQLLVLEEKIDVNFICGGRKGAVSSVWAEKFSLLNGSTDDEALHLLMGDALTWMMSTSVKDKSLTTQEFYRGEHENFARFIIGHSAVGDWAEAPVTLYEKQQ